jgi:hypothetical protein
MQKLKKSLFQGVYIVAKFFTSKSPDGSHQNISRTLGKLGLIDKPFRAMVENRDIWVCQILEETRPGTCGGAFILKPVKKIDHALVRKAIPGFFNIQIIDRYAVLTPNSDPQESWMLEMTTRRCMFKEYYATIVPIAFQEETAQQQVLATSSD